MFACLCLRAVKFNVFRHRIVNKIPFKARFKLIHKVLNDQISTLRHTIPQTNKQAYR